MGVSVSAPVDKEILFRTAEKGDILRLKEIVEYTGTNLDQRDEEGNDVLHYGALSNHRPTLEYLVERCSFSPLRGNCRGITPYDVAYREKKEVSLEYFREVTGFSYEEGYHDPVERGFFPDPSLIRVGEDYYMVNSSFVFFPCIPISHSRDLVHWEIIGHAITNPKWAALEELEGGRGFWAPDISYYNGRFYITATYRLNDTGTVYRKQFVMSSDKPEGPYSQPAVIDEDGIDPSIFHENGRHYMLLNRGARIFELNEDCTKQISEAKLLYYGDMKRAPEGPHILKKDGYYYLFLAEGGTGPGHRITVARSRTLMGNYEPCPYNPIMRQMDEKAAIQRCGHGKPVSTPDGKWYMVYLCGRRIGEGYSMLGRETALDPITWTADGWPLVNMGKGPSVLQKCPDVTGIKAETDCICDKVSGEQTKRQERLKWMTPRAPENGGITFLEKGFRIKGSRYPLDKVEARNILLQRQTTFCFLARAVLCVPPLENGQEVGLTCYYDENTWVNCYISKDETGYFVQVKEHIGTEDRVHEKLAFTDVCVGTELTFYVETEYLRRRFICEMRQEKREIADLSNVYYLCDEGIRMGKRFTGAMIGIYAYAGKKSLEAEFLEFDYEAKGE